MAATRSFLCLETYFKPLRNELSSPGAEEWNTHQQLRVRRRRRVSDMVVGVGCGVCMVRLAAIMPFPDVSARA